MTVTLTYACSSLYYIDYGLTELLSKLVEWGVTWIIITQFLRCSNWSRLSRGHPSRPGWSRAPPSLSRPPGSCCPNWWSCPRSSPARTWGRHLQSRWSHCTRWQLKSCKFQNFWRKNLIPQWELDIGLTPNMNEDIVGRTNQLSTTDATWNLDNLINNFIN